MSKVITLVDYGIGNIFNVKRAIEHFGMQVVITNKPEDILNATALVLPGVGAFSAGMQGLMTHNLVEPIKAYALTGKPFLGICLGMQLLFSESHEFGIHKGLGIIDGKILPVKPVNEDGQPLKVPHIGWSKLDVPSHIEFKKEPLFKYLDNDISCYFVHSFTAFPASDEFRLADTDYGNFQISAIVKKNNVYGCQFHPEKSGQTGLNILQGFLDCV